MTALVLLQCFFGLDQHYFFLSSAPGVFSAVLIYVPPAQQLQYQQPCMSLLFIQQVRLIYSAWFLTLTATISQKNTCKYLGTQMSCSRLLCVPLLPCFRGRLRCSRHLVPDRFAGSGATKGLLRPGPRSFLSFLPWALCLCPIFPEYFPSFCTWQLGWTHCSVIALWFMLHFLLKD